MYNQLINLTSIKETDHLARFISKYLCKGTIILMWGEMGSGKTTFTKSLCSGLGVSPRVVTSPTYTLVNIYTGVLPIFHVDLFRLNSSNELEDFDRQDLINDNGITIVEWPKLLLNFLSDEPILNIKLEALSNKVRRLNLESSSSDFDTLFRTLKQQNFSISNKALLSKSTFQ